MYWSQNPLSQPSIVRYPVHNGSPHAEHEGEITNSVATCTKGRPLDSRSAIAPSLNAAAKFRLGAPALVLFKAGP